MLRKRRAGYDVIIAFLGEVTNLCDRIHSFLILIQFIVTAGKHEDRLLFKVWIFCFAHGLEMLDDLLKLSVILHLFALDQKGQREGRCLLLLHLNPKTLLVLHLFLS